jgi:peptidoglycan/LPS O-acetylase OafA/YrhL
VAYHIGTTSGATVLPGGFLGVDVFFVLSGYLITSLLIVEAQHTGRISIRKFYIRRARRLLPALFALLLAVAAVGAFWLPQQAARLRGDLLASLAYVTNWWLIAENSSYFATAGDRPPMLTHLWSLAVEEQYYLVWPLVLVLFAAVRTRRGLMLTVLVAGIAASTVAGLMMYDPFSDPSRVYYGTDTRALAPLLGAALAILVKPWRHRPRLPRGARHGLDLLGVLALLALAVVAAVLEDTAGLLYRGGLLGIAVLGAVVVGVAGHPGTALGEMLALQPLRWLGERSYAIYLWHWPVCLLTRPGLDVPLTGWANAGLRVGLSVLLAEVSYWLIERPIRRYGFLAPLRRPAAPVPSTVDLRPPTGPHPVYPGRVAASAKDSTSGPLAGPPDRIQGGHPVRVPTGAHPVHQPTGAHPVRQPTGAHAVRPTPGPLPHPVHPPTGTDPVRVPTGAHAVQTTPTPRGGGVYASTTHAEPVPTRPARRPKAPIVRTVVLAIAMVAGATFVGQRLNLAAGTPFDGGPLDVGPAATLGALGDKAAPPKPIPVGATVAFFGDSQGMTLLLNQPADLDNYIEAVDATIEGCGILLGKVESRTGERRNLTSNCANWRSTWSNRAGRLQPTLAVIMLGAWDVFDLTLDSGPTLRFGTSDWDANFTQTLAQAVDALRWTGAEVALSLLPCYRPIAKSAGFWPERGDDQRTRHVNELLRAQAKSYPSGVRTLEPPAEFCTNPVIAEDTAYRWDGVHYYKKGAALYFAAVLPQLMTPGTTPTPTPSPSPVRRLAGGGGGRHDGAFDGRAVGAAVQSPTR